MKKLLATVAVALSLFGSPADAQFADQATYAGTSTGSANAYAITVPNVTTMADILGVQIKWQPNFSNTGDSTIAISGLSPVHIYKPSTSGPVLLTGAEFVSSPAQTTCGVWDGSKFQLTCNLNSVPAAPSFAPQGYLTPCQVSSGSPVSGCTVGQLMPTGDVSGATNLYYEPVVGNNIPIYNGSGFVSFAFSELTLAIPSSRLANTIYDVCVFSNSGTPTVVFGPAWTTSTAGSGARGSGAGTAQITQLQGVWVNAVSISAVNGGSGYTVPANQCTIVATVAIDSGAAGQVSFSVAAGQSRNWAAWNFYNQLPISVIVADPTSSWTYNGGYRASNGASANNVRLVTGLPSALVDIRFKQNIALTNTSAGATTSGAIGIGVNSTTTPSGLSSGFGINYIGNGGTNSQQTSAQYTLKNSIGLNAFTSLETATLSGSGSIAFNGASTAMELWARFGG